MKKISLCSLLVLLILVVPAHAENKPLNKLSRGVVNVATAPVEIPKQVRIYWKEGAQKTPHIIVWILSGFVKGSVNTVTRISSGAWDIVSFPWAVPEDYQPLVKPDYVFSKDTASCSGNSAAK